VVKEMTAKNLDETLGAEKMGYPVVLKGRLKEGPQNRGRPGKSNLWTKKQLRAAYEKMSSFYPKPHSFLISPC